MSAAAACPVPTGPLTSGATGAQAHALFEKNVALVYFVLKRMPNTAERLRQLGEDAVQAGLLGLWRAATRFRPELGYTFGTFACVSVRHAIINALRVARSRFRAVPFSVIEAAGDEDDAPFDTEDKRAPLPWAGLDERRQAEELLKLLPAREREAVARRFGLLGHQPQLLSQIAQALGLSQERVRQLVRRSVLRLRRLSPPAEEGKSQQRGRLQPG
jgi:RNA polymerase sigma factor (sigma-70 family)